MVGGASQTRQSSRERVQTPKARELNMRQLRMESSDTEDAIVVIDTIPAAPQPKRTEITAHLRDRIATTKVRALAAKADRSAATASNPTPQEKGTANAQIKALTDLGNSLLQAIEDQNAIHQNQIEVLTKTVTQQMQQRRSRSKPNFPVFKYLAPPHRMPRSSAHHRTVGQAMYECSPRWAQPRPR
jgi:hypothetical protein